ncbi:2-amino-4-hydroxy-6-hydroxymethyldihydropteridine diphosphokinase [Catenulispora sp. NF23]|uniref:2-amino-4-hydroxy-6-hydroxymethyldihydropteridine diphosphokinase n=1 Tax=Catenulispora pinistramenti TaxID=2705254 RepID=A0ABS5KUL4_9ACTN|nr:2-amino-4-hydroxy-6-hydroxymethyldihydropteridine diphosphokinase [Catenulispora pinistramenti]MBS2536517.1 2-amino-4-hydroxy-6-hydroxymethyldihydropteridine diphosphokinase [Catenulispora pinistramenti]MBS2549700.1 2-amino-4-hydroxy-6-hydroxymethyldihydropteridine diphosphokinase [Catenulispora pinistramenti]
MSELVTGDGSFRMHSAVLAIGGNLGDRLANLQTAVDSLADTPSLTITWLSPVYETAPLLAEGAEAQDDYLNAVLGVTTALPPDMLLMRTQAIEEALGRTREVHWGSRTIDIDIVQVDELVSAESELTLPHPRAAQRAFVLAPWYDARPEDVLTGVGPIADLLTALGGAAAQGAARRDDLELMLP